LSAYATVFAKPCTKLTQAFRKAGLITGIRAMTLAAGDVFPATNFRLAYHPDAIAPIASFTFFRYEPLCQFHFS